MKIINLKDKKGITLITLVITIIVLMILAGVTVTALTGEKSTIKEAKGAASSAEQQSAKEKVQAAVLGSIKKNGEVDLNILNKKLGQNIQSLPTIVTMNGIKITISEDGTVGGWIKIEEELTNGDTSILIGDYINNYDELSKGIQSTSIDYTENGGTSSSDSQTLSTENLGWKVLNANSSGGLELISDKPTESTLYLRGETGYLNAEKILNDTCDKLYGQGTYAISARSLNLDDIIKLNNHDMSTHSGYGDKWIYKTSAESTRVQYSKDGGTIWTDASMSSFKIPGKEKISTTNYGEVELTNTFFDVFSIGDGLDEDIGKMISDYGYFWLASKAIQCETTQITFRMNTCGFGVADCCYYLYYSYGYEGATSCGFRPVVSLDYTIQLTGNSTDGWNII